MVPSDAGVAMVTKVVYVNYFKSSRQQDSSQSFATLKAKIGTQYFKT